MKEISSSSASQRVPLGAAHDPALAIFAWKLLVGGEKKAKEHVHFPFLLSLRGSILSFFQQKAMYLGYVFVVPSRMYFVEVYFNDTALILYIVSILKCSSNASLLQNCCLYI